MKKILSFIFFCSSVILPQTDTTLILSEIMFTPQTGNNEFIEIFNLSETESIDLNGYKFKYYTTAPDVFIDAGFGTILPPRSYAVIFENDYDVSTGIYSNLVPSGALILKISDNAFGSTGMANTEIRPCWLLNPMNDTIDVYTYSPNNPTAISDEKIVMNRDSSQSNWANSLIVNGSPGFRNSVALYEFDLQMVSLNFNPAILIENDDVAITAKIKNRGTNTADNYIIEIYNDADFDSLAETNELIFSQNLTDLNSGDSIEVETFLYSLPEGEYQIIAQVIFSEDENANNNKLIKRFTVYPPANNFNDIVINEIMYAPLSPEPEWIELYNRTDKDINLKKWKFSDAGSTVTLTNQDILIEPENFIVITSDSSVLNYYDIPVRILRVSLPALNNTGDNVVIKDSLGVMIDSLTYLPSWGGSTGGRSLERFSVDQLSVDSTNWATSISLFKATPGKINSITPKNNDLAIIKFTPKLNYSIIGDSIEFQIRIKNIGINASTNFNLDLYGDVNSDSIPEPIEMILSVQQTGINPGDSLEINISTYQFGTGTNNFIAFINYNLDDDTTNNIAFTKVTGVEINEVRNDIVINEFMYSPVSPEPEWIEIFNRSNKIIDLKNYKIADNRDTVTIITKSVLLNPGEFYVIASDSSINNFYNIPSGISYKTLPALNNTGDKIVLIDSLRRTIDSLEYLPVWGGSNGNSLERIQPDLSSIDSANWKTSTSIFKATPGYINSVTKKDFDIVVTDIIFNPVFPLKGENVEIFTLIKNIGKNSALIDVQLYQDTDLDSIPDQFIEQLNQISLDNDDSIKIKFSSSIIDLQEMKGFFVKAIFTDDQDTTNNYFYRTIEPGFPSQSIVVNEIMFTPLGGEPEWIELFNRSNVMINLKGWSVTDVLTTPVTTLITSDLIIQPGSYIVLTRDSLILNYHRLIPSQIYRINLPVLNNDLDGVVIKDNRGLTIDSVFYNSQWGGTNGYSLERISVDASSNLSVNWASSIDIEQSTPGRINSLTPKQYDLRITGLRFEPRFPIAGDDVFIIADIKNSGSAIAENFIVEFFIDSDSNNVIDLLLSSSSLSSLNFDDSISVTSSLPITNIQSKILAAVNIVYLQDEDNINNYFEKSIQPGEAQNVIVINEVMYNPADGEPEWIEFVNISDTEINLANWSVSDIFTTPTKGFITTNDFIIQPDEYFIISKDSTIYNLHPEIEAKVFYTNFGSLGNTSDGIIIYDYRDGIIDSLFYRSSWGGKKGYSLERISFSAVTNDSLNWATSLSISGSTPGKQNSFYGIPSYQRNTLIINEVMFDPETGNSEYVELLNLDNDSVNIGGWKIEDENSNFYRLSEVSFIIPPKSFFVLASDSSIFTKFNLFYYPFITVAGTSSLGLVNTGELILLKDVKGNIIDSVWYTDKWHNRNLANTKGKSLERINPSLNGNDPFNWSTSVDILGGTPCKINSIFSENLNIEKNISVSPNPFSPDNDGFEDFTIINYNLSYPTAQVRIKVFDNKGRLLRTLLNNSPSGQSGSVIFNGLDDDGQVLRIGIYIIFLEAMNDNAGVIETMKTVVVVARKL